MQCIGPGVWHGEVISPRLYMYIPTFRPAIHNRTMLDPTPGIQRDFSERKGKRSEIEKEKKKKSHSPSLPPPRIISTP